MNKPLLLALCAASSLSVGCVKSSIVKANDHEFTPPGAAKAWVIGGEFDKKEKTVVVQINGDPVLKGRFPPQVPKLTMADMYQKHHVVADCEFTTDIIANRIASAIVQGVRQSGGNRCHVKVSGQEATTLYF